MLFNGSTRNCLCNGTVAVVFLLAIILSGCGPAAEPPTPTIQPTLTLQLPSQTASLAPTASPAPSQTPTRPAAFPLAGFWSGNAKNGTFEMQVTIILQSTCQVGQVCGTFDLKNVPCSGTFSLVGQEKDVYEFRAGSKQGTCGVGRDFLQLLPDGNLQYTSRGDYGETLGTLTLNNNPATPAPVAQKLPVIFDDDGSPDGTTALLYLLSDPGVALQGVIISHGEAHPQIYIQHMGRMLDAFGITGIALGAGQDGPLAGSNEFPEWLRQSASNFWGMPLPNPQKTYPVQDAAQLFISLLKKAAQPVAIFVSGPCTDLARALQLDPTIRKNIRAVYIMGGAVYVPGNLSDLLPNPTNTSAEWNIYADPQAAQDIFAAGLQVYLVPLDATNQVKVSLAETSQWRAGGKIAAFSADIYDMLLKSTQKPEMAIWDMMTAELMLHPDLCSFELIHLDVVTKAGDNSGHTMVNTLEKPNVRVCLKPNVALVKQKLVEVFSKSR